MRETDGLQKTAGLLSRAVKLSVKNTENTFYGGAENTFISFHQFALDFHLHKSGVFIENTDFFALAVSHGLDRETLRHPEIPAGYWQNLYFSAHDSGEWTSFSGDNLRPFLPLFSQTEQQEIMVLHLKTFECNRRKLILCVSDTRDFIFGDDRREIDAAFTKIAPLLAFSCLSGFPVSPAAATEGKITEALKKNYEANKLTLDFLPVFNRLSIQVTAQDKEVLAASLQSHLTRAVGPHNICCAAENNRLLLIIFTQNPFQAASYDKLLKSNLQNLLGDELSALVAVLPDGTAESGADITAFLHRKV